MTNYFSGRPLSLCLKKLDFEIASDTGNPAIIFYTEMHYQAFISVRFMPKVFHWIGCVKVIKVNGDLGTDCTAFLSYFHCITILIHKQITAYVSCLPSLPCTRRRRIPELLVKKGKHLYSSLLSDCLQSSVSAPITIQARLNNGSTSQLAWTRLEKGLTTQRMIL